MEAKGTWEINETNTTEKAMATRYYCHRCRHVVTVDVEPSCPSCQGGFIQACESVASLYLTMPSESELSENGSDGESTTGLYESSPGGFVTLNTGSQNVNNEVDAQRREIHHEGLYDSSPSGFVTFNLGSQDVNNEVDAQRREVKVTPFELILLFTSIVIEIASAATDLITALVNPRYAPIGTMLAFVAVLVCIWELDHNRKKEGVELRRRGMLWCFYYPPPNNKIFCPFPEIAGLSLAIAQFICSGVEYHFSRLDATSAIKLSILTAILVFCSLVLLHLKLLRLVAYATLQNGT